MDFPLYGSSARGSGVHARFQNNKHVLRVTAGVGYGCQTEKNVFHTKYKWKVSPQYGSSWTGLLSSIFMTPDRLNFLFTRNRQRTFLLCESSCVPSWYQTEKSLLTNETGELLLFFVGLLVYFQSTRTNKWNCIVPTLEN